MGKYKFLFIAVFLSSSFLYGQTSSGYFLVKTASSATSLGENSYQLVASNNTSSAGNFFFVLSAPANETIQSILPNSSLASALPITPVLPLTGPASVVVGPFSLAASSSVTFQVVEEVSPSSGSASNQSTTGDTFMLVTQSQWGGKANSGATASLGRNLTGSAEAVPNLSRNGQPIDFSVSLNGPARINLVLFALTGEKVYQTQAQGSEGANHLSWALQNTVGQSVASGLYVYVLQVFGNGREESRVGKIVVVR